MIEMHLCAVVKDLCRAFTIRHSFSSHGVTLSVSDPTHHMRRGNRGRLSQLRTLEVKIEFEKS